MKAVGSVILRILALIIVWGLLMAPLILALRGELDTSGDWIDPATRFALEVGSLAALLLATYLILRFVDRRSFSWLGLPSARSVPHTLAGIVVGAVLLGVSVALVAALGGLTTTAGGAAPNAKSLGLLSGALLANAATQEVLCRGYVLQIVETRAGRGLALLVSSLFFVLLHGGALADGAWWPAVNLFLAGVFFGLAFLATRSLWLPIGAHFSWNLLLGPVLGLTVSGVDFGTAVYPLEAKGAPWLTGGSFGIEGGLATTVALALGIAAFLRVKPPLARAA